MPRTGAAQRRVRASRRTPPHRPAEPTTSTTAAGSSTPNGCSRRPGPELLPAMPGPDRPEPDPRIVMLRRMIDGIEDGTMRPRHRPRPSRSNRHRSHAPHPPGTDRSSPPDITRVIGVAYVPFWLPADRVGAAPRCARSPRQPRPRALSAPLTTYPHARSVLAPCTPRSRYPYAARVCDGMFTCPHPNTYSIRIQTGGA